MEVFEGEGGLTESDAAGRSGKVALGNGPPDSQDGSHWQGRR